MAILAIFGGYFGYFLQNGLFLNSMIYHFGKPTVWAKKWPKQIFWQIDLDGDFVKKTCVSAVKNDALKRVYKFISILTTKKQKKA